MHSTDRRPARFRVPLAVVLVVASWVVTAAPLAALEVPYLSGRVIDDADLLPPERAVALDHQLQALEEETGAQVVVLTIPSLEGEVLEDYTLRVAETWGIGRGKADDGVILLVSRDDRQLRIEVGYGLEGTLPDLAASRIIRNVIVPRFKAGDYPGGIEEGVNAISGAIRKEPGAVPDDPPSATGLPDLAGRGLMGLVFLIVVGTFSLSALGAKGCQSWFLYLFLTPFYFTFPMAVFGPKGGVAAGLGWLILFPVLRLFLDRTPSGKRFRAHSPMMRSLERMAASSGGIGGGGGGFSGGGGGFSGGGGSFGGGGASGSW